MLLKSLSFTLNLIWTGSWFLDLTSSQLLLPSFTHCSSSACWLLASAVPTPAAGGSGGEGLEHGSTMERERAGGLPRQGAAAPPPTAVHTLLVSRAPPLAGVVPPLAGTVPPLTEGEGLQLMDVLSKGTNLVPQLPKVAAT